MGQCPGMGGREEGERGVREGGEEREKGVREVREGEEREMGGRKE